VRISYSLPSRQSFGCGLGIWKNRFPSSDFWTIALLVLTVYVSFDRKSNSRIRQPAV